MPLRRNFIKIPLAIAAAGALATMAALPTGAQTGLTLLNVSYEYLNYWYTEEGQDIAGKHFCRPAVSQKAQAKYARQFRSSSCSRSTRPSADWPRPTRRTSRTTPRSTRPTRASSPPMGRSPASGASSFLPPQAAMTELDSFAARAVWARTSCAALASAAALAASPMPSPSARTKRMSLTPRKPNTVFR